MGKVEGNVSAKWNRMSDNGVAIFVCFCVQSDDREDLRTPSRLQDIRTSEPTRPKHVTDTHKRSEKQSING